MDLVSEKGADAVLVTHVVHIERHDVFQPPTQIAIPVPVGGYYGRYVTAHDDVTTPGYMSEDLSLVLETTLFDVESGALVWSAQPHTFALSDTDKIMTAVVKAVAKRLETGNVLTP